MGPSDKRSDRIFQENSCRDHSGTMSTDEPLTSLRTVAACEAICVVKTDDVVQQARAWPVRDISMILTAKT